MDGLARAWLQACALWRESSLSYPNVSFTQRIVLCTDVTFPDDLVACVHKSRMHTSRSHAQPRECGLSHPLGIKTAGVRQCKQNGHVPHVGASQKTQPNSQKVVVKDITYTFRYIHEAMKYITYVY